MSGEHRYDAFFRRLCSAIFDLPFEGKKVFLYPHINADGDALGSALAFALLLEAVGIDALILSEEELSPKLAILPQAHRLIVSTSEGQDLIKQYGAEQGMGIVIDSPGGSRIGRRLPLYQAAPRQITIDHHIPTEDLGTTALVDVKAAASCEIITAFVLFLERRFDKELLTHDIAVNLFSGLMTDTGRFTYSNTTAETLRMAAELLRFKIDIRELSLQLFDRITKAKLALTGYVDSHARYYYDDKMIISLLPYAVYREMGGEEGDVEGLASFLRDVEGVELAVLLRETEAGTFRASVRSGSAFDAQAYAMQFGGGGHIRSSGFTLGKMTAEAALNQSVEAAATQFSA